MGKKLLLADKIAKIQELRTELYEKGHELRDKGDAAGYREHSLQVKALNQALSILYK